MSPSAKKTADWVAIQTNPFAGSRSQRDHVSQLVDSLREHGLRPLVFKNRERLAQILKNPKLLETLRCIVAAGGDGTVGDVLNRYPTCRIAVLPLGTENLLARYLGIPKSGRAVAEMIVAGHVRTIDLASVGQRRFALMASIGFDADVVQRMDAVEEPLGVCELHVQAHPVRDLWV